MFELIECYAKGDKKQFFKDSKKTSEIYKNLKPLLKSKNKS